MALTAEEVFRDYVMDGVPSSGVHEPKKSEIRSWGGNIELLLNAGGLGGAVWEATKALLSADLAHGADTLAVVYEDAVSANNGLYVKVGGSGSGLWSQITTFLPGYQFVTATDDGGSTADAYTMDTNPRLPFGDGVALVEFVVPATNTSSTVTVSFDGDTPLMIKTASGNAPAIGGLVEGMPVSGVKIGSDFFMRSDQASAALVAAAEAAATEAEGFRDQAAAYADFARNNWAIAAHGVGTGEEEDIPLLVDPGSVNNMFVVISGVFQFVTEGAYSLGYDAGSPFIRMTVPLDVPYEVKVGNAITVGTASDGSVTEPKLGTSAVTETKLGALSVSTEKLQDGAATKPKIANDSIDETKLDDTKTAEMLALLLGKSGGISSGIYVPTGVVGANIQNLTPNAFTYIRIMDQVIISGTVTVDFTAGTTTSDFAITLPVPSDFGSFSQGAGTGSTGSGDAMYIVAHAASNTLSCTMFAPSSSAYTYSIVAMYRVI